MANDFNFQVDNTEALTTINILNHDILNFTPGQYKEQLNKVYKYSAMGGFSNQIQTFMIGMDRYHQNILPPNREHSGLTFITRPKLNLTSSSLKQDRLFAPLDTMEVRSMNFAIRCLLDTKFTRDNMEIAYKSPLIDVFNPFNTPLCNGLTGISGFPDPVIQSYTTEGGYHTEDQSFAIGADGLRRSYDFTLNFKDIQFGPIAATFEYWLKWIELYTKGIVIAYSEDINAQRIPYTVSIYRFVLDPSRRYIRRYAKATGCYPTSLPIGAMMNVNDYEIPVQSVGKFSVPFKVNHVLYNDYLVLVCFNMLMERYCPGISKCPSLPDEPYTNFYGLPYIVTDSNGLRIVFKDITAIKENLPNEIMSQAIAKLREKFNMIKSVSPSAAKATIQFWRDNVRNIDKYEAETLLKWYSEYQDFKKKIMEEEDVMKKAAEKAKAEVAKEKDRKAKENLIRRF